LVLMAAVADTTPRGDRAHTRKAPRTLINCLDSSLEGVDTAGGFVLL